MNRGRMMCVPDCFLCVSANVATLRGVAHYAATLGGVAHYVFWESYTKICEK